MSRNVSSRYHRGLITQTSEERRETALVSAVSASEMSTSEPILKVS